MVKYWTPWHFMLYLQDYSTSRELIMNNIIKRKFQNKINFDSCTCIFYQEEDHKNDSDCKKPSKTLQQLINSHNMEDLHKCELKRALVSINNTFNIFWNIDYHKSFYEERIRPLSPNQIFSKGQIDLVYYILCCWTYKMSRDDKQIFFGNIPEHALGIVIEYLIIIKK